LKKETGAAAANAKGARNAKQAEGGEEPESVAERGQRSVRKKERQQRQTSVWEEGAVGPHTRQRRSRALRQRKVRRIRDPHLTKILVPDLWFNKFKQVFGGDNPIFFQKKRSTTAGLTAGDAAGGMNEDGPRNRPKNPDLEVTPLGMGKKNGRKENGGAMVKIWSMMVWGPN